MKKKRKVLILPMRNGNNDGENHDKISTLGSYPTYEEWKPSKAIS